MDREMKFFDQRYADLRGQRIGHFLVEEFVGRDAAGAPCWRVVCLKDGCNYPQTLRHSRLAPLVQGRSTQSTLLCANPACPLSRHENRVESIDEFRRQQRRESIQSARMAAEEHQAAETKAGKDRLWAVRNDEIQRQYIKYVNHQWMAGQVDERICGRQRWFELSDVSRRTILDIIEKGPTVRIAGL
jgi:hypothetical protein